MNKRKPEQDQPCNQEIVSNKGWCDCNGDGVWNGLDRRLGYDGVENGPESKRFTCFEFCTALEAFSGPKSKCLVQPPVEDYAIKSKDLVYLQVSGRYRRIQCDAGKGRMKADNFNKGGWEGFKLERE